MAHHAALAPNNPDGSRPPAKSLFRTLWTSSALAAPLSRPPDQLISRKGPVGHHSEDLVPASVGQLHRGERKLHLPLHCWQRLFDQPLPGSYEPILRAGLGVPYPVGHEVHLSPLLTRVHTMLPNLAVQRLPVLLGDLGHRTAELRRHVNPHRKLDHPEPLVSTLRAVPQQLPAGNPPYPTSASPFPPRQADGPALQSTLATADGPRVRCRPETPNARSTRPLTSR